MAKHGVNLLYNMRDRIGRSEDCDDELHNVWWWIKTGMNAPV